jgi:TldD protein
MEVYVAILPVENDPDAIKQVIWRITDKAYKNAAGTYASLRNNEDITRNDTGLPDFSKEKPSTFYEEPLSQETMTIDPEYWIQRLQDYTAVFSNDSLIFHCDASFNHLVQRKYFVSTEGSRIAQNEGYVQIQFLASIQHDEGTILPLQKSFTARVPGDLPDHEEILAELEDMHAKLKKMRHAPLAEPYAGPAILSPAAAGVFFHEIFGHRIEGHRLQSFDDGQTFKEKVGDQVLPKAFNVYSDPELKEWEGQYLIGEYNYDDQGIKGQRVNVVENGVLKNFLMSRRPMEQTSRSNGHGRAQVGYAPVSRQSNLIIETEKALTEEQLRKQLIKACKKQHKEYGYYFKEVVGGLTFTDRYNANVFNINPTEVYKVYVDGRPDELVIGVELIGTPLTMFSNILAAGDKRDVFTGFCGAESGRVPVTTVAPAIFVEKIETQKTPEYESKLPLLPDPTVTKVEK